MTLRRLPLIKLTEKQDTVLFLIQEELKSRRLFSALSEIGLDECWYQPQLDSLILKTLDLNDGKDETFEKYSEILDRRSKKIEEDQESVVKQAMKAFVELQKLRSEL